MQASQSLHPPIGTVAETAVVGGAGQATLEAGKRTWLISPAVDILFVCGIAPWLCGLLLLMSAQTEPVQKCFDTTFIVASLLIGESHQFTSIVRYFSGKGGQKKHWPHRVPFWLLYLTILTFLVFAIAPNLATFQPVGTILAPWGQFLTVSGFLGVAFFPVFLMQHVCAQAKAVGMIYCGKQGYKFSKRECFYLSLITWLLVGAGACTLAAPFVFTAASAIGGSQVAFTPIGGFPLINEMFLSAMSLGLRCMAGLGVVLFAGRILQRGLETSEWLPFGAGLMWANLATLILAPITVTACAWVFVPLLFHATQHWAVAWVVRKSEVLAEGRSLTGFRAVANEIVSMSLPVQAVTLSVLFFPLLTKAGLPTGASATLDVFFSMLVFYVHYFSDRLVWRRN